MKNSILSTFIVVCFVLILPDAFGQEYTYEPSEEYPFGQLNPDAPAQLKDYQKLIGLHDCISVSRGADNEWADSVKSQWKFKYIMNGMAVQDETLKGDGTHSGSIRQFNADSAKWYVHYYSTTGAPSSLPAWGGNLDDSGEMVLYRPQKAPNGMEGYYKIRFYDISDKGFNWLGAWVDTEETVSFPLWKIFCECIER